MNLSMGGKGLYDAHPPSTVVVANVTAVMIPGGLKLQTFLNTRLGLPCLLKHSYLHPDRKKCERLSVGGSSNYDKGHQHKQTNKHL